MKVRDTETYIVRFLMSLRVLFFMIAMFKLFYNTIAACQRPVGSLLSNECMYEKLKGWKLVFFYSMLPFFWRIKIFIASFNSSLYVHNVAHCRAEVFADSQRTIEQNFSVY